LLLSTLAAASCFVASGSMRVLSTHTRPTSRITALTQPTAAKQALYDAIVHFDKVKSRDGTVPVDFGVKGGELDDESRAPKKLDFYSVSPDLGNAADAVISAIQTLEPLNPTADATQFFGTEEGAMCPLHGSWCNMWTNAADATFSANSSRGDARVYNSVDGVSGKLWNVIDFLGDKAPLEQFRVRLSGKAVSPKRIEIVFRFVKARLRIFFGLRLPRPITLTIPVPGPFLTRILFFFTKKKAPPAYFELLYLDEELRVHLTGQGNLFVQRRPKWG